MSKLLQVFFNVGSSLSGRRDNDLTDRLVGRYTTSLFVGLCVVVTSTTYVGQPIHCWCPAQFTGTHTDYTNAHCLISPTYIAPFREALPQRIEPERRINYYVWVPLILICQAFLCVLPGIFWRSCYRAAGINVPGLVDRLNSAAHSLGWENHDKAVQYVVHHMSRYLQGYRSACTCCQDSNSACCCMSTSSGNYVTCCYLATKFLYFIVTSGQFVGLNWFLGFDFIFFGLDTLQKVLTNGASWIAVERFPKVTMCEFSVRHMHKVHTWVVQCVLPINLFNERIFLLLWFWLLLLSLITLYSFCKWTCQSIFWTPQIKHVKSQLRLRYNSQPRDYKTLVAEFSMDYLRRDSMLLLRILSLNAGTLMEGDVLMGLWSKFYRPKAAPTCPEVEHGPYCSRTLPSRMNVDNNGNTGGVSGPARGEDCCQPSTLREVVAEMDRMLP